MVVIVQVSIEIRQTWGKSHWRKRSFCIMNLINIWNRCNLVNYKINLKHCGLKFLKGSKTHYLINKSCWIVAWIPIACRHKMSMPLYITVTSNGLFLFKSSEEKCVQNSAFENYFKTNLTNASGDDAKMFHWKYCGRLKIMSHKDHEITLYIYNVWLFGRPFAPSHHKAGIQKKKIYLFASTLQDRQKDGHIGIMYINTHLYILPDDSYFIQKTFLLLMLNWTIRQKNTWFLSWILNLNLNVIKLRCHKIVNL